AGPGPRRARARQRARRPPRAGEAGASPPAPWIAPRIGGIGVQGDLGAVEPAVTVAVDAQPDPRARRYPRVGEGVARADGGAEVALGEHRLGPRVGGELAERG